jgi:dienelactone hydrolase
VACALLVVVFLLALSPTIASADVRTQPIMPLNGGAGASLGDAHVHTRIEGGDLFVTVSAQAVSLPSGGEFRLVSCAQTHVLGTAPAADCDQRDVDTRHWIDAGVVVAPVVSRRIGAPSPLQVGWAVGMVEVLRRISSGEWQRAASSWAPEGLAAAALPLSDRGLPQPLAPQGVVLGSVPDGGVNTGARNSICSSVELASAEPLPDGVTSGAVGAPGPAYSETGAPLGADGVQRGVVLLLHPGGWMPTGSWAAAYMRPDADRWRARGWRTVNASYRGCGASIDDVVAFVDHIRARMPDDQPLCIVGISAGAQLALLAAARRPVAVDCVVSHSGPTDLQALATQQAYDPATGGRSTNGPIYVHNLAVAAFGAENLMEMSPNRWPIAARMLVAVGEQDWALASSQATAFASAQLALHATARVEVLLLPAGPVTWGHGSVAATAIDAFHAAETALSEAAIKDRQAPATSSPAAQSPQAPSSRTFAPAEAPLALPQAAELRDPARPCAVRPSSLLAVSPPVRPRRRQLIAGGRLRIVVCARRRGRLHVTIRMRGRTVARVHRAITVGRSTTVTLRPDRPGRAQLRRARRPRLQLSAALRDESDRIIGAASRTIRLLD